MTLNRYEIITGTVCGTMSLLRFGIKFTHYSCLLKIKAASEFQSHAKRSRVDGFRNMREEFNGN